MDVAEHLAFLQHEGALLARCAADAEPGSLVTTVPDWTLRDCVRHVGGVHRWAAATIRDSRRQRLDTTLLEVVGTWPDDADLVEWFRAGHADLVETIGSADPDLDVWHFFAAPSPIAFWARRQAHETAIHRADVQSCVASLAPFAPAFAADGVDEILFGFAGRRNPFPPADPAPVLRLRATDADQEWWARLGPESVEVLRGDALRDAPSAACTVEASASDLYLLLWNRIPADDLQISGDPECLSVWRDAIRVRWSE